MSKSTPGTIDEMIREAWNGAKSAPNCIALSLNVLRAIIDESSGRTLTNEEFASELSRMEKAGEITFIYPDVVELRK